MNGFTIKKVDKQLTKGLLDLIVLGMLKNQSIHGYGIISGIRKNFGIYFGPSTIYPFLKNLELTESIVFDYLINVYNTILYKDIISKYQIRNVTFLENLVRFLADNVSSLLSAKKISDFLKSQNINT